MRSLTTPLSSQLPAAARERLRAIGEAHPNILGRPRDYQDTFDEHVAFFEELAGRGGVSHQELAALLAEVGICGTDGRPLSRGTISSGLCRARERAAARTAGTGAPASVGTLQLTAAGGSMLQQDAIAASGTQATAASRRERPQTEHYLRRAGAAPVKPPRPARRRPVRADATSAAEAISTDDHQASRNARAATLLNQLRS